MQQEECFVRPGAADMDMLAENGELLAQVAVEVVQVAEAGAVGNALLAPVLEGMGAAAADADVEPAGPSRPSRRAVSCSQGLAVGGTDAGGDFDHAGRDFRLDVASEAPLRIYAADQDSGDEVVVVGADQLQFGSIPRVRQREGEGIQAARASSPGPGGLRGRTSTPTG